MRSTSSARFGSPVSASCVACFVRAAWAACRLGQPSACASAEARDLALLAFWALRSVKVRQVARRRRRRAASCRPGPGQRRCRRSRSSSRSRPPGGHGRDRTGAAGEERVSGDPTIAPVEHDSNSAKPPIGVEDQPARRERRRAVAHVLDEDPVRAVGGRQREHASSPTRSETTNASTSPAPMARSVSSASAMPDEGAGVRRRDLLSSRLGADDVERRLSARCRRIRHSWTSESSSSSTTSSECDRSPMNLRRGRGQVLTRVGAARTPWLRTASGSSWISITDNS